MIAFLLKVWGLARPYRGRLFLGVLTGLIAGLIEPLVIATVVLVYALIFPTPGAAPLGTQLHQAPAFLRDWLVAAQQALTTGVSAHPAAVLALVGMIPPGVFLRRVF